MSDASASRLLVISRYFPPAVGGSAILMGNLLREYPRKQLHVIRGMPGRVHVDPDFKIDVSESLVEMPKALGRYAWRLSLALYPAVLGAALKEHRRRRFTAVLGCWPLVFDLEFAYGIHKLLGLPLYIYMHDLWSDAARTAWGKRGARLLERHYLRAATTVLCITDEAAAYFRETHNVNTHVLPHSVNWRGITEPDLFIDRAPDNRPATVVFCGAIYDLMNTDSLLRINEAVQSLPVVCMVCCTQTPESLENRGLGGPRLSIFTASRAEAFRQLRDATIVCLPLAFQSYAPIEVQTVFPTKTLDYLICGRPILVHAPRDSFLARDARTRGWGYVVDSPDVSALRDAIQRLIEDVPMQRQLVAAAWQEARRRDSRIIAAQLYEHVSRNCASKQGAGAAGPSTGIRPHRSDA